MSIRFVFDSREIKKSDPGRNYSSKDINVTINSDSYKKEVSND